MAATPGPDEAAHQGAIIMIGVDGTDGRHWPMPDQGITPNVALRSTCLLGRYMGFGQRKKTMCKVTAQKGRSSERLIHSPSGRSAFRMLRRARAFLDRKVKGGQYGAAAVAAAEHPNGRLMALLECNVAGMLSEKHCEFACGRAAPQTAFV